MPTNLKDMEENLFLLNHRVDPKDHIEALKYVKISMGNAMKEFKRKHVD